MDEEISKWIIEFLLRQKLDDKVINGVLTSLPLKDGDNHRLKKTILLRKIESEVTNGSVSEALLDWLETIEEIDHRGGERKSASDSMKKAYCDVAVDCVVRFLDEDVGNNAKYFEAVKRVWRERVCKIEGLASEESKRQLGEIEAAVWDSDACGKLLGRNTRNEALKSVRVYVAEAWRSLGPTVLELVAEKAGTALEELRAGGGSRCRELPTNAETTKAEVRVRRKHVAKKSKRVKGAKISDTDERNEDKLMDNGNTNDSPAPEVEKVVAPIIPSSVEPNATMKANPPSAPQTTQTLPSTKVADNMNTERNLENQKHPDMLATPEVNRIQEELKSNLMELHAVVKDPLPDALQLAETLSSSTLATNNRNSSTSEPVVVEERGPEIHAPGGNTENRVENAESDNPTRDPPGNEAQQHQMKLRNSKRNLMEPNGTAHTYEWNDSIDNLPGSSSKRPRLPSPTESKPPSPLKGYDDTKFSRNRVRKKWTQLEEDTLRTGVQKFGKGNWNMIWLSYRDIFKERTKVDLKDKWRNMTRLP